MAKQATKETEIKSAVNRDERKALSKRLGDVLASSYVLYHKIHAYHWNVVGPLFYAVHKLTDEHYQDIAGAIDEIAERIRALGFPTPVGLSSYMENSVVKDVSGLPTAEEMIRELSADHHRLSEQMRKAVEEADKHDDVFTADLLTARIGAHEEAAWMLTSLLGK